MGKRDYTIIVTMIIVIIVLITYFVNQFMVLHPYWSIFIGSIILFVICLIIYYSFKNQAFFEKEKGFLNRIFGTLKLIISKSAYERKERKPIPTNIKNMVYDNAGDKCQICGKKGN